MKTNIFKLLSFSEKLFLLQKYYEWNEYSCEERLFDLSEEEDKDIFCRLYGWQTMSRLLKVSQYWIGGENFYADEENKRMWRSAKVVAVTESNIDNILADIPQFENVDEKLKKLVGGLFSLL